jgi:hypothetical protein
MNRNSINGAKKVIEKLFPQKGARNAYLKIFSEAITEARKHGEEKWGVTLHADRIRLIIGNLVVCTLHKGYIWFVLPGEEYPDFTSPKEIPGWDTDSFEYKSISSVAGSYQYSKDYHTKAWPQIKEQHFKFLELAAEKCKKLHSKSREKHSPGVLKYLKIPLKRPKKQTPEQPPKPKGPTAIQKQFKSVVGEIKLLQQDPAHTEKAHEALVVSFYEALGYKKFSDIKYQLSKIDIAIQDKKRTRIVNEVKRSWNLSNSIEFAREQAYNYALKVGARFVVVTNGDYYAIYDRDKGRSFDDHFIGDFNLTELTDEKITLISTLMKK